MKIDVPATQVKIIPPAGTPQFLMIKNTGGNRIYFGAEENTSNGVDSDTGDDIESRQGIPLEPGEFRDFSGERMDLGRAFYLAAETGTTSTLNYSYGL
jgi:hypothetical protein